MLKSTFTLLATITFLFSHAQTDCEAKFNGGDVMRWRGQLNFIPKYLRIEKFDYMTSLLDENDCMQFHIEISVNCDDAKKKQNLIQNMKYFWDNRISEEILSKDFPAYYIFYQFDQSGLRAGNSGNYPSEKKTNTNASPDLKKKN